VEPAIDIAALVPGDLCANVREVDAELADVAVWLAITSPDDLGCCTRLYVAVHPVHRWYRRRLLIPGGIVCAARQRCIHGCALC